MSVNIRVPSMKFFENGQNPLADCREVVGLRAVTFEINKNCEKIVIMPKQIWQIALAFVAKHII